MRNPVSEDYFSFMSERGKGKIPLARPAAIVPPPVASSPVPARISSINPDSGMQVTETSISDTMIQRIFRLGHTGEASAALDD